MKIVVAIARILMGLAFFVLGLNGFLNFIPSGPMPTGLAGDFINALLKSHYVWVVAFCQVIGGLLLLINRYVTLGLVLLGPVIVNILAYHLAMDLKGIVPGLVMTVCWAIVAWSARKNLAPIFSPRV